MTLSGGFEDSDVAMYDTADFEEDETDDAKEEDESPFGIWG